MRPESMQGRGTTELAPISPERDDSRTHEPAHRATRLLLASSRRASIISTHPDVSCVEGRRCGYQIAIGSPPVGDRHGTRGC